MAARQYLKILQLAARDSQDAVQDALRVAIQENATISVESDPLGRRTTSASPPVTDVVVDAPDLQ